MPKNTVEFRMQQAAIISRLMLFLLHTAKRSYRSGENVGAVIAEIMVGMAILVDQQDERGPADINRIMRATGLPRNTIRRALKSVIEHGGVVKVDGDGINGTNRYATNVDFIEQRVDASFWRRYNRGICFTSRKLGALEQRDE